MDGSCGLAGRRPDVPARIVVTAPRLSLPRPKPGRCGRAAAPNKGMNGFNDPQRHHFRREGAWGLLPCTPGAFGRRWAIHRLGGARQPASPAHALNFAQIAPRVGLRLVLENCHRRRHSPKADLPIEPLAPRHRVKDDLFVRSCALKQSQHDLFAETPTLVAWQHGDVAQVGAVPPIGEAAAHGNEFAVFARKGAKHAVFENELKIRRALVPEWRGPIERGKLFPVDIVQAFAPVNGHGTSSTTTMRSWKLSIEIAPARALATTFSNALGNTQDSLCWRRPRGRCGATAAPAPVWRPAFGS